MNLARLEREVLRRTLIARVAWGDAPAFESPLDRVRALRLTPTQLRLHARNLRIFEHHDIADLCELDADAHEVAERVAGRVWAETPVTTAEAGRLLTLAFRSGRARRRA